MLVKFARSSLGRVIEPPRVKQADRIQHISLDPSRYFYLDDWAVSAYEKFGLNDNADGFEREELKRSYASFVGSWVCLDHDNASQDRAVGENIDAVLTPDDYVRVAMAVNRAVSEARHPGLEDAIVSGRITDSSMGCICQASLCTIPKCANLAADETQFCKHVRPPEQGGLRGRTICTAETNWLPVVCGELNRGVQFFENSIITDSEGADKNAKFCDILSARMKATAQRITGNSTMLVEAGRRAVAEARTGEVSISAVKLYNLLYKMAKTGTALESAVLMAVVNNLVEDFEQYRA